LDKIEGELNWRDKTWTRLLERGGPDNVPPDLLRELGLYGGAAGIWADLRRTRQIVPSGIAVGLLHTGSAYPDDISESGVLYHYPTTQRSGHDETEIEATQSASKHKMPVFVITHSSKGNFRDVHRAFVLDWDDTSRIFLISFSDVESVTPLLSAMEEDESPFALTAEPSKKKREINVRDDQPGFKFRVLRRYGPKCAVCSIRFPELLDAAHIREIRHKGSNDARNGIVLCATHHRAFDRGLFWIEPDSLRIIVTPGTLSREDLGITIDSLKSMPRPPHADAIQWRWERSNQRGALLIEAH